MTPKRFTTYGGWRRAAIDMGAKRFEGDKDIAWAWAANGNHVGEWDGAEGYVVGVLRGQSRAGRRLLRGGMPHAGGEDTMGNPTAGRVRVGDMVMGIQGVHGGYAGRVTAVRRDGRGIVVVTFVGDDGVERETPAYNVTTNVPAKGTFPRKNPDRPLANEDEPVYVEYVRKRQGEEPFTMGGTKWEFVTARDSKGRLDIGVYSFAGDVTYSYNTWRRMFNIGGGVPKVDPRVAEMRRRLGTRRNPDGGWTPEEA